MANPLSEETTANIRDALSAGRKLDAVRLYREATGTGLAEAKAFVDQLESGSPDTSDVTKSEKPAKSLTDFGWNIEPTDAGVRLRHSTLWYGAMTGGSLLILLIFSPFVVGVWFAAGKGFWQRPLDDGAWQILWLLIPLLVAGGGGLIVTLIVVQILRFALLREAWDVGRNSLVVRRRLLGISRSREHRDGELVLEPHYDRDRSERQWCLAILSDGKKHFLLPEPMSFGFMSATDSHAECLAIANVLATHTGWSVRASEVAVEGQTKPPDDSDEAELLAALQSRGFAADVDERLRLTILPPKLGQWIGGLVLLAMGLGWLWVMAGAVNSFVNDAQAKQQPLMQLPFWLLMTPMLMVGVGLCALGVASFFGREHWIVDRNLLLVRSRLFGWKSEHEYVNAHWKLARVRRATSEGNTDSVWQLQLENQSGRMLKELRRDRDDDIPRLLGTLLSQRTGWPLRDTVLESETPASNSAEVRLLTELPPPGNRIQCRLTGKKLILAIAPRPSMGCFPVFALGCLVLCTLWVTIDFAAIKAGQGWTFFLVGSLFWIAWICWWLHFRFGKRRVLIEPGRLVIRYEFFGWKRTQEYVLDKELDWASLMADYFMGHRRGPRQPVYHVHISTSGRAAKFGTDLTDEEQEWLVARINQHLGHEDKGVQRAEAWM